MLLQRRLLRPLLPPLPPETPQPTLLPIPSLLLPQLLASTAAAH